MKTVKNHMRSTQPGEAHSRRGAVLHSSGCRVGSQVTFRRGAVLLLTLITIAMASLVVASLLFRTRAEQGASSASQRGEQAYEAAMSGITQVMAMLKDGPVDYEIWYDNPEFFRHQVVCSDETEAWYFTVYAGDPDLQDGVRYGLIDESGKVNINFASEAQLLKLPGMTEELVQSLMDWRDPDDEAREAGAEIEYYAALSPIGYRARNGPILSIEELRFVKGFGAAVIYGEDANANGLLDPNEDDQEESFPSDNADGLLDTGLLGAATTSAYERNVDFEGKPRVNINGPISSGQGEEEKDEEAGAKGATGAKEAGLSEDSLTAMGFSAETVEFILLYRADGGKFKSLLDLIDKKHTLRRNRSVPGGPDGKKGQKITSGISADDETLSLVLDKLTTASGGARRPWFGRLNVNSASEAALAAVPGLGEEAAKRIVEERASIDDEEKRTPAWLVTKGFVELAAFQKALPFITSMGFQYRVRCVGYGLPSGRFCVLEAMIDIGRGKPRIRYLRNLTRVGMPLAIDPDQER